MALKFEASRGLFRAKTLIKYLLRPSKYLEIDPYKYNHFKTYKWIYLVW